MPEHSQPTEPGLPTQRRFGLLVLSLALTFSAIGCQPKSEPLQLVLLHTNDVHARFLEINAFGGRCSTEQSEGGDCFGGAARRATVVERERQLAAEAGKHVLLVDGGDQFQGTLFYGKFKGLAAARVMNELRYDAMVVGNHEFDDGPEVLANFAQALDFPLLATNVDVSRDESLKNVLQTRTVVDLGTHQVGIVGFITEETPDLSSPGPTIAFLPIEERIQAEVDQLRTSGVETIIALSHSGYERDLAVARTVAGIDIIVGGHTNTLLSSDDDAAGPYPTIEQGPEGDPVAVVTAFAWGKYLGKLDATFEKGRLTHWDGESILLDASVKEDAKMAELIEPMATEVDEFSREVIGEAAVDLDGREATCRFRECNLGNLITDALLEYGRPNGAEIALINGGGIRSSILRGRITIGDFLAVMPFGNTASNFKLKGSDIKPLLEHAVSRANDPDNDGTGRFLQVAGLRYAYTPSAEPGDRIRRVVLVREDGMEEQIDPNREYSFLFNAFNRNGGDGFEILTTQAIAPYDQGRVISDVVIDYLRKNSPVAPQLEGRIEVLP